MSEIILGDSLDELKHLLDDSVDVVITDPPYGYSFMGKDWDKAVPSVEIWEECLRVLKPGAFACVMSAPRSDVQQAMTERLIRAGFRLDFTPIYWTYASGFPKATNIGKVIDKKLGADREVIGKKPGTYADIRRDTETGVAELAGGIASDKPRIEHYITAPGSPEAKALDGSYAGFQPKPAVEVVIIAMKPLSEKTYVDQALKNGHGVSWLDDGRIPYDGQKDYDKNANFDRKQTTPTDFWKGEGQELSRVTQAGRFPANLLVSDDVLNDGRVTKSHTGSNKNTGWKTQYVGGDSNGNIDSTTYEGDTGSYSRYFDLDSWARERLPAEQAMTFPFAIFPKASKSEKNKGLTDITCTHPTVKPLKLMSYLITLFSREGDTVLDPFVGSGTTVVAAEQLGRIGIGIEREAEYAEIARARLAHIRPLPEEPESVPPVTMDEVLESKPVQMRLL